MEITRENARSLILPAEVAGPEAPTVIEVGSYNDSFVYRNAANTDQEGSDGYRGTPLKDLFYKFTITEKMDIQITNYGPSLANEPQGEVKNYGYLIKTDPYELLESSTYPENFEDNSVYKGRVHFTYIGLKPGTYYAIFEANQKSYLTNIFVEIIGTLNNNNNNILNLPAEVAGPDRPTIVEVGTFNNRFEYRNAANTDQQGSDGYRGTSLKDLFYKFTITEKMDIQITNYGPSLANEPQGEVKNYGYLIKTDPYELLESSTYPENFEDNSVYRGRVHFTYRDLQPGTYYVIFEANQKSYLTNIFVEIIGTLSYELNLPDEVAGPEEPTIIEVGIFNESFEYRDAANTDQAGSDGYRGTSLKDLFYKFTITETMDIQITNYGPSLASEPQGEVKNYGYLIKTNPYELLESSTYPENFEDNSVYKGRVHFTYTNLQPGTYYVIFEANQKSYLTNIFVEIIGRTK